MLHFRFANIDDLDLYFRWANDKIVREQSFNSNAIRFEDHFNWFKAKVKDENCYLYLFLDEMDSPTGQVRIDRNSEVIIGISIDEKHRGKSYGKMMLSQATEDYFKKFPSDIIHAYIKQSNIASVTIFEKAGFTYVKELKINEDLSYLFEKSRNNEF